MSNESQAKSIDFADFGRQVFIGRPKGLAARKKINLDAIDAQDVTVTVTIPASTYSVNSSFFLGLFGKSIRKAGSRDAFLRKFVFRMPTDLNETVDSCIERALFEKGFLLEDDESK